MNSQDYSDDYARDRAEIEDLMARYLFALDYNDLDTFIAMFTEDAVFDFARGRIEGKGAILEAVKGFKARIGELYKDEDGNPAVLRHVLAHAAIRLSSPRLAKYWSLSASGERTTGPSIRTCRCNASQWSTAAALGRAASSRPLRDSKLVKKTT